MTLFWSLFKGSVLGLVLGAVGIIVLTLAFPRGDIATPPVAPQTDIVAGNVETREVEPVNEIASDAVARNENDVETPEPDSLTQAQEPNRQIVDSTPAALPDVQLDLSVPDVPVTVPDVDVAASPETPVFPNPQSRTPEVPISERDVLVSTEPSTPPAAVIVQEDDEDTQVEVVVVEEPSDGANNEEDAVAQATPSPSATNTFEEPADLQIAQAGTIPDIADQPSDPVSTSEVATLAEAAATPDARLSDDLALPANVPDIVADTAETRVVEEIERPELPAVAQAAPEVSLPAGLSENELPPTEPETPLLRISEPAIPRQSAEEAVQAQAEAPTAPPPVVRRLLDRDAEIASLPSGSNGIRINRIRTAPTEEAAPEPDSEPEVSATPASDALNAFAKDFENPDALPLLSVLLIDDGSDNSTIGAENLPVTVVLDAAKQGVADRMAELRSNGIEVAKTVGLPVGATASDIEIALEASAASLTEVVAYVDVAGVAQNNRNAVSQFLNSAAERGQGMVIFGGGLNSGLDAAEAAGVPAAQIYRDLTDARQSADALSRFFAQAAFQARQNGSVILVARLNAETLTALAEFAQTPRGKQVALAPLSAVLKAQ